MGAFNPPLVLRATWSLCTAALALVALATGCGKNPSNAPATSGASGSAPPAKRIDIRFAHAHAPDSNAELHFSAETFAKAAAALSPRFDVKIYPQGTLGTEREVYEGMQLGSGATMSISGTAILNNFDQRIGVLDLPYLWKDYDHVHRVLDGEIGRDLAAGLEKQGLVVLGWLDSWGWRNLITTRKPVKQPEDLQGMKIRTIQTPVYVSALKMMGANPTPMAYGEIYTALQTGVIDGFEQAAPILVAEKYYEVTKHLTFSRHLFGPLVICYSKSQWDRLTPEEQGMLRQAAAQARDEQRAQAKSREETALRTLRERGMQLHEIDTRAWEQAAIKLQDQIARERGATDLLEKIRRAGRG